MYLIKPPCPGALLNKFSIPSMQVRFDVLKFHINEFIKYSFPGLSFHQSQHLSQLSLLYTSNNHPSIFIKNPRYGVALSAVTSSIFFSWSGHFQYFLDSYCHICRTLIHWLLLSGRFFSVPLCNIPVLSFNVEDLRYVLNHLVST